MDGIAFIALAGKLAAVPAGDEASYRTAVSRAYYGAFRSYAMVIVESAHRVVSALDKCRRDDVLRAIRQAIEDYERKIHAR